MSALDAEFGPRYYAEDFTQAGAAAPVTTTVLVNTLRSSPAVWTRVIAGQYTATFSIPLFPVGARALIYVALSGSGVAPAVVVANASGVLSVDVRSWTLAGALADGIMNLPKLVIILWI